MKITLKIKLNIYSYVLNRIVYMVYDRFEIDCVYRNMFSFSLNRLTEYYVNVFFSLSVYLQVIHIFLVR